MTRMYEVDPANTANVGGTGIVDRDRNGIVYRDGAKNVQPQFSNVTITTLAGALPDQGIYLAVEDNATCGPPAQYYNRLVALSFVGAVGDAAARVHEAVTCEQIDIELLREQKMMELNDYRSAVRLSACESSNGAGGDNWAIITGENARELIQSIDRPLSDRDGDILQQVRDSLAVAVDFDAFKAAAGGWKTRWPGAQQVNIGIRHKDNGTEQAYPISDIATWGLAVQDIAIFDRTIDTAYLDAEQDIRTETVWSVLAAIDVTSYAWPAFWPGE